MLWGMVSGPHVGVGVSLVGGLGVDLGRARGRVVDWLAGLSATHGEHAARAVRDELSRRMAGARNPVAFAVWAASRASLDWMGDRACSVALKPEPVRLPVTWVPESIWRGHRRETVDDKRRRFYARAVELHRRGELL